MNIKIFIIELIIISKIFCDDDCPSNCVICDETKQKCTKCESGYVFYSPTQNEINCILLSVASKGYYKSDSDIYYSCTNDAYGYRRNNEDECFKKDVLAIKNYYSYDDKHYYPCDEDYDIDGISIEGIDYCNRCELDKEDQKITCLNCKYGYAFKNRNYLECFSKEDLSQDKTLYKYDDNNYLSCELENCLYCSSRMVCTQCIENYFLKNSKRDKCFQLSEIDPINQFYRDGYVYYTCYLNGGVSHCKECLSKDQCTKCEEGYTILDDNATKCEKISELNSKPNLYYTHNNGLNYYSCVKYDYDNKHCLKCNFEDVDNFKCLQCDENYYFKEGQDDNCFEGSSISNYYYKKNEIFYDICSNAIENCETCESNQKCLTCSTDYGILDDNYTICQEITSLYDEQYIYQDNNLYYTCELKINGCKKCTDENTCIETLNYEYCILEDNSVYQLNLSSDIYYHSPLTPRNDYCIKCDNNFELCSLCIINSNSEFECIECELGFSLIDKSECDYSATYAINEQYFSDDNYINFYKCDNKVLSSNAIDHCLKCEFDIDSNSNNCNECNTGYIILDDNLNMCIYKGQTIIDQINNKKLVANELETKYYTCSKLFINCETCENLEYCSTCKENYAFLDENYTECILKDDLTKGHFYTNDNGINYYSCIENCFTCENIINCITCDEGYELNDLKTKCIIKLKTDQDIRDKCVYVTYNTDYELNNIAQLVQNYYLNYQEEMNYLVKYINPELEYTLLIFKNYQCSLFLYEEDNKFKIDTEDIINEFQKYINKKEIIQAIILYKNHTTINFYSNENGNIYDINTYCPACLQKKYKLIYNYGYKLQNEIGLKFTEIIKENQIDIFNELNNYFQDFCENLQISGIDIPLNERLYLLYKGNLSYNLGDPMKGNLFACDINCSLVKNIPEELTSECECDIEYDINKFIEKADDIKEMNEEIEQELDIDKEELKNDYNFLDNSNNAFSMFTCTKGAFSGKNIKINPGFYTVTTCIIFQSLFFLSLICKQTINSFAKLLVLANPPKTKTSNDMSQKRTVQKITDNDYFLTQEEDKNKYNYVNKETNTIIPTTKMSLKNPKENVIYIKDISNSDSGSNSNSEKSNNDNGEFYHQRMNIYNGNKLNFQFEKDKNSEYNYYPIMKFIEFDINVYRDTGYSYEQKDIKELKKKYEGIKMIKYNLLFKNEKDKLLPLIYKPLLKDFLPFKYARYYDKRTFCDLYKYFLFLRHPIINLFINENNICRNFIPFSVKAIKIIFFGVLILFFNSLLISQKYLYEKFSYFDDKYNFKNMQLNDDVVYSEKIKYGIKHNWINSFYAYLIILLIDIFLSLLLSIRFRIKMLLDEFYLIDSGKNNVINKNKKEQKNFAKELLKCSELKKIYLWIVVIFYVFLIAFFIYLINFCHTYKGEIPDLFFSSLWTFLFFIIFPFFTNIIITLLRLVSLKENCEFFFEFSKILIEI